MKGPAPFYVYMDGKVKERTGEEGPRKEDPDKRFDLLSSVIEMSKQAFFNDGSLLPTLFLEKEGEEGKPEVIIVGLAADMNSGKEKDAVSEKIRELIQEHDPNSYIFVTEAWFANLNGKSEEDKMWAEVASQYGLSALPEDKRKEVIVLNFTARKPEKEEWMGTIVTHRDKDDNVSNFEEPVWNDVTQGEYSGRFVGMG